MKLYYLDCYLKYLGWTKRYKRLEEKEGVVDIIPSETCTEEDLKQLNDLKDSYNWEKPDWWMPQVKEFRIAVFNSLPAEGKVLLAPVLMSLTDEFISNPSSMQAYWGALVEMSPQWLDEKVIGDVLHAAQKFNIPLISEGK